MSKFVVEGGSKLSGIVRVQGSKNAAFPVIAACILTNETCTIKNVPDILDVRNFLETLEYLGADLNFEDHILTINTKDLKNKDLDSGRMSKLRGSLVIAGAMLARFGHVRFAFPGGDAIGSRPIDVHLDGFRKLGADVREDENFVDITAKNPQGTKITMRISSVTGTENLILASVLAEGKTEIMLAATEPHVQNLCRFLNQLGAQIEGVGTPHLVITGAESLRGGQFIIGSDEIEALTFCVAAAVTRGQVKITGVELANLDAPFAILESMNVNLKTGKDENGEWVEIGPSAGDYRGVKITTGVFPALLTDEQPLLGVLATQSEGETLVHDWIYEGRQGYLRALEKMGARVRYEDIHRATITGPTPLIGAEITTPDLRAGASVLIAALIAKGQSIIYNAEIIDRGYEKLDEKLRGLGARIERVN